MEISFKRYVAISERTLVQISTEIKQSRQNCHHWVHRDTPVYVEVDPTNFEKIIEVSRREVLYPRSKAKAKRQAKKVRQVKK